MKAKKTARILLCAVVLFIAAFAVALLVRDDAAAPRKAPAARAKRIAAPAPAEPSRNLVERLLSSRPLTLEQKKEIVRGLFARLRERPDDAEALDVLRVVFRDSRDEQIRALATELAGHSCDAAFELFLEVMRSNRDAVTRHTLLTHAVGHCRTAPESRVRRIFETLQEMKREDPELSNEAANAIECVHQPGALQ